MVDTWLLFFETPVKAAHTPVGKGSDYDVSAFSALR